MRHHFPAGLAALCVIPFVLATVPVLAADDLLETLARKGVISVEEYEKLKASRKADVTVSTEDGFRLVSGDGSATLQVGTLQQLDFAVYRDEPGYDLPDGSEFRRSRISVGGTFLKDWQYRAEYEFAGNVGVTDAYVAYNGYKPLVITAGNFKQPFGMDALAADKSVAFMERALPVAFIAARAPGLMLSSSGANWSAAAGLFGEPLATAQSGDEGYGGVARATWAPWLAEGKVLHLGVAASLRNPTQDNLTTTAPAGKFTTVRFASRPESNQVPNASRLVDTGDIRGAEQYMVEAVELAWQQGAASLQAEYTLAQVERDAAADLDFSGWYAQFAYTLTGEGRRYKVDKGVFEGIRPARNFGKEGWGAVEVATRYSMLDLQDGNIAGGEESNAAIALNWYLTPFLRISTNVIRVLETEGGKFDGKEPTAYQMRLQMAY